jgi:hypothetical protein
MTEEELRALSIETLYQHCIELFQSLDYSYVHSFEDYTTRQTLYQKSYASIYLYISELWRRKMFPSKSFMERFVLYEQLFLCAACGVRLQKEYLPLKPSRLCKSCVEGCVKTFHSSGFVLQYKDQQYYSSTPELIKQQQITYYNDLTREIKHLSIYLLQEDLFLKQTTRMRQALLQSPDQLKSLHDLLDHLLETVSMAQLKEHLSPTHYRWLKMDLADLTSQEQATLEHALNEYKGITQTSVDVSSEVV